MVHIPYRASDKSESVNRRASRPSDEHKITVVLLGGLRDPGSYLKVDAGALIADMSSSDGHSADAIDGPKHIHLRQTNALSPLSPRVRTGREMQPDSHIMSQLTTVHVARTKPRTPNIGSWPQAKEDPLSVAQAPLSRSTDHPAPRGISLTMQRTRQRSNRTTTPPTSFQ